MQVDLRIVKFKGRGKVQSSRSQEEKYCESGQRDLEWGFLVYHAGFFCRLDVPPATQPSTSKH